MNYRSSLYIILACCATPAFAIDFEISGNLKMVTGLDENVYFVDDSGKDGAYGEGQLRLRTDLIFSPTLRYNTEFQVNETVGKDWPERKGITVGIYHQEHEHFNLRSAYLAWDITSRNATLNVGLENISLPSHTFGNPILNTTSLAGFSYHKTYDDNDKFNFFLGTPVHDHKYIDHMYIAGLTYQYTTQDLEFIPYFLYSHFDYYDDTGFGFTERLKKSYMNVIGFASTYSFSDKTKLKFDLLYGDHNNEVAHYYETKGYHLATEFDHTTSYATPGFFAWYSSGTDEALDEKHDFGFVPTISSGGFSPTRLGFKHSDNIGRQGIISETGVGTAGIGLHIKDIQSTTQLSHTAKVAYIKGTTSGHGRGTPVSATVPSLILPNGEAGAMTNKDHAVEFNFDSRYQVNKDLSIDLDMAYIISDFDNSKYDKNPANVQVGLNYQF